MFKKLASIGLAASVLASSAMAATAEFYVAQDVKTHKCQVVDKKPDGKTAMDVGTKAYATKANAEDAMSKLKDCK